MNIIFGKHRAGSIPQLSRPLFFTPFSKHFLLLLPTSVPHTSYYVSEGFLFLPITKQQSPIPLSLSLYMSIYTLLLSLLSSEFPFSNICNNILHNPHTVTHNFTPSLTHTVSVEEEMSLIPSFFGTGRRTNVFDPFSLDIWDPFQDFTFPTTATNTALSTFPTASDTAAIANTRIDWRETPEAHVFKADVPGLKKEEVKVEVEEGRVLQISGERTREKEDKNDTWHRLERSSGRFLRRFRLPENAKVEQVKASLENGVLTVTVPKEEIKRPDVKPIQITG